MARRSSPLVKIAFGLAALALLGYLFASTLEDVGSAPYTVVADQLEGWTIGAGDVRRPAAPALMLRPPTALPLDLFDQVFQRTMESYTTPADPGIPLVLPHELGAAAGVLTADALTTLAVEAGLDGVTLTPRCVSVYRTSVGREQRLFFVLFDLPAFGRFRAALATRLRELDPTSAFEAEALSPALLVAASEAGLLGAVPPRDALEAACEAPVAVGG